MKLLNTIYDLDPTLQLRVNLSRTSRLEVGRTPVWTENLTRWVKPVELASAEILAFSSKSWIDTSKSVISNMLNKQSQLYGLY